MTHNKIIFIIGGCRSGKSRHALDLARQIPGEKRIFIATCIPRDPEMRQRVNRHQADRDDTWSTLEVPIHLDQAITATAASADVIVVDCLTLWLNNLFEKSDGLAIINRHVIRLAASLKTAPCPVILVSNEVGMGIVPNHPQTREYRDLMGHVNQAVAACADRVIFTVAGIPMTIKGKI